MTRVIAFPPTVDRKEDTAKYEWKRPCRGARSKSPGRRSQLSAVEVVATICISQIESHSANDKLGT
eukprot:4719620-Pleurochrysis_carterae.AAC.2